MKTIIIAEAGVNYNGSLKLALKLVDYAAKAKADFIKFQTYSTNELVQKIKTCQLSKEKYQTSFITVQAIEKIRAF